MDESSTFYDLDTGEDDHHGDVSGHNEEGRNQCERDTKKMPPPAAVKRTAINHDRQPTTANQQEHTELNTILTTQTANEDTTISDEFETMVRDAENAMKQKLEDNKEWVAKSVRELSTYAKALSVAHAEYKRILHLERAEAERLDRVEPDVQGATQHMLNPSHLFGGTATPVRSSAIDKNRQQVITAGAKRNIGQV